MQQRAAIHGGLIVLVLAATVLGGCGIARGNSEELLVFTAASLAEPMERIGQDFEASHPGVTVRFNIAGSQRLAGQIIQGAQADVFASADMRQMRRVEAAGLLSEQPRVFARGDLAIAVERGNPLEIEDLADLADPAVTVVMAGDEVPAGRYARLALEAAGVDISPASLEADVSAVLAKVVLGEADAGIVYRSDIAAAGDRITGVPLPPGVNVAVSYPVAVLETTDRPETARAFIDELESPAARRILEAAALR